MTLFELKELEQQLPLIHSVVPPSPCYQWPLLDQASDLEIWVKHENHNPTGAFKVRGGVVYIDQLLKAQPNCPGVISATRGNHGQSIALAAKKHGLTAVIVVPEGNSLEKNAAMQALGCELVISGKDFDQARLTTAELAEQRGLHMIPSFHKDLVLGVASYALEMFQQAAPLDRIYVPIGMGSGICAVLTTRDLLGLDTEVIGVVSTAAPSYQLSFQQGKIVTTDSANTFADGMACRQPVQAALDIIRAGAARVISVNDDEIAAAQRLYYSATHNIAEGAGAAALAAALQEKAQGGSVGLVLSGGNIDSDKYAKVLSGGTPKP